MLALTTAPVSSKKKKAKKADVSLLTSIENLKRRDGLIDNAIIFHYSDGSTKVSNINKQFVTSENGRYLPTHAIVENMNALMWDYGADSYSID